MVVHCTPNTKPQSQTLGALLMPADAHLRNAPAIQRQAGQSGARNWLHPAPLQKPPRPQRQGLRY